MPVVKILHSEAPGHAPAGLQLGQIAINTADGILFWLASDGVTVKSFNFLSHAVPTQSPGDNSTNVANTAFVTAALAALAAAPPAALATLAALAAAVGNDPNFSTSVANLLASRLRVDGAQGLGASSQASGRNNLGLGALAVLSTLPFADVDSSALASASDYWSNATSKLISVTAAWSAAQRVELGNLAGTVTLNMATGLNFNGTLTGNITLAFPTGFKSAQSGTLSFRQDATGGRTVTFASGWFPIGGSLPILGTAPNEWNYISFQEVESNLVYTGGKFT